MHIDTQGHTRCADTHTTQRHTHHTTDTCTRHTRMDTQHRYPHYLHAQQTPMYTEIHTHTYRCTHRYAHTHYIHRHRHYIHRHPHYIHRHPHYIHTDTHTTYSHDRHQCAQRYTHRYRRTHTGAIHIDTHRHIHVHDIYVDTHTDTYMHHRPSHVHACTHTDTQQHTIALSNNDGTHLFSHWMRFLHVHFLSTCIR